MDIDAIRTIAVVGAGTMGAQIAQQCALHGYDVSLVDTEHSQLVRALRSNQEHLQRRVDKGKITSEEMQSAYHLVRPTTDLEEAVSLADFVIEAIVEDLAAKRELFGELNRCCRPDAILATNSSAIGISQLATGYSGPGRCINMHFFHPALVMRLVEIMPGPETAAETVDTTVKLAYRVGKEPVAIKREISGMLVNRILGAIKREAFWLAEEGYASPHDIDRAVRLGLNHPMGPFELSDFSGLDIYYNAALQRYRESGDEQYRPPRILEEKIEAGHLGRKTGKGFYDYSDPSVHSTD
jgi:3-hydroxybutyryl-CoA dehydrogenase